MDRLALKKIRSTVKASARLLGATLQSVVELLLPPWIRETLLSIHGTSRSAYDFVFVSWITNVSHARRMSFRRSELGTAGTYLAFMFFVVLGLCKQVAFGRLSAGFM